MWLLWIFINRSLENGNPREDADSAPNENMDNQKHCMSIKRGKLTANAHKHNLLNVFCNNGYVYVKQLESNNNTSN